MKYKNTVDYVDIPRFMGEWYVWAGRTTFLERGAHNSLEVYRWNEKENRIDVDFTFRKGSFDGELKKLPQKAWIENKETNAHWKIQLFWPLKFDYLVIALDPEYRWTAIGVPNGKNLWIMGRKPTFSEAALSQVISELDRIGYPTQNIERVPQKWD